MCLFLSHLILILIVYNFYTFLQQNLVLSQDGFGVQFFAGVGPPSGGRVEINLKKSLPQASLQRVAGGGGGAFPRQEYLGGEDCLDGEAAVPIIGDIMFYCDRNRPFVRAQ